MLAKIQALKPSLRKSEQKVADLVLKNPESATRISVQAVAKEAGVSEPTVIRFCHALQCEGFKDFKLKLAKGLVNREQFIFRDIDSEDQIEDVAHKVVDSAVAGLLGIREQLDTQAIDKAVDLMLKAKRVEFYGLGGSGIVALDAQQKFFRLGISVVAYTDPHIHNVSASLLDPDCIVVAISHTGRSKEILRSVQLAKQQNCQVIAITIPHSPLASLADVLLGVNINEDSDLYAPIKSRLAQIIVLDVLAVSLATRSGKRLKERLDIAKLAIADKFVEID